MTCSKSDIQRLRESWESESAKTNRWFIDPDRDTAYMAALEELKRARREIREEFARLYGWRVSPSWFTLPQLQGGSPGRRRDETFSSLASSLPGSVRHVEFYRDGRRPAALLVHTYQRSGRAHAAIAKRFGLRVERLAFSWYFPHNCIAVMYTRGR